MIQYPIRSIKYQMKSSFIWVRQSLQLYTLLFKSLFFRQIMNNVHVIFLHAQMSDVRGSNPKWIQLELNSRSPMKSFGSCSPSNASFTFKITSLTSPLKLPCHNWFQFNLQQLINQSSVKHITVNMKNLGCHLATNSGEW